MYTNNNNQMNVNNSFIAFANFNNTFTVLLCMWCRALLCIFPIFIIHQVCMSWNTGRAAHFVSQIRSFYLHENPKKPRSASLHFWLNVSETISATKLQTQLMATCICYRFCVNTTNKMQTANVHNFLPVFVLLFNLSRIVLFIFTRIFVYLLVCLVFTLPFVWTILSQDGRNVIVE